MSVALRDSGEVHVSPQWQLAEALIGNAKAPEKALQRVFDDIMKRLGEATNREFDSSLRNAVWNRVSADQLSALKAFFISQFCERILKSFQAEEISAMLEEQKNTGSIKSAGYSLQIQMELQTHERALKASIGHRAYNGCSNWDLEIIQAIKEEGIKLPEF